MWLSSLHDTNQCNMPKVSKQRSRAACLAAVKCSSVFEGEGGNATESLFPGGIQHNEATREELRWGEPL